MASLSGWQLGKEVERQALAGRGLCHSSSQCSPRSAGGPAWQQLSPGRLHPPQQPVPHVLQLLGAAAVAHTRVPAGESVRQAGRQAGGWAGRQAGRQAGRRVGGQAGRWAGRQPQWHSPRPHQPRQMTQTLAPLPAPPPHTHIYKTTSPGGAATGSGSSFFGFFLIHRDPTRPPLPRPRPQPHSHVELNVGAAHPFQHFLGGGGDDRRDEVVHAAMPHKQWQLQVGWRHLQARQRGGTVVVVVWCDAHASGWEW